MNRRRFVQLGSVTLAAGAAGCSTGFGLGEPPEPPSLTLTTGAGTVPVPSGTGRVDGNVLREVVWVDGVEVAVGWRTPSGDATLDLEGGELVYWSPLHGTRTLSDDLDHGRELVVRSMGARTLAEARESQALLL